MNSLTTTLPLLLPVACAWVEKQELIVLEQGTPLNECQLTDARLAGVENPEKIRVLRCETLPQPEDDDVIFAAKQVGLFSARSAAITVGHGICLRHGFWDDRAVLVHECVHVSQYEKMGGIRPFLATYLRECIDPGYPFGRLEQEAIHIAKDICKPSEGKSPA
jgi:hypothetical protein